MIFAGLGRREPIDLPAGAQVDKNREHGRSIRLTRSSATIAGILAKFLLATPKICIASHAVETSPKDSVRLVKNSRLYQEFLAERDEILRHKWIESEKVGYDIGFERALFDWIVKYRSAWVDDRRRLC